ncbi:MAG: DUF853 family protein [Candidatus Aenigmarchaeota archaeon]|nr:DUF853 family protein [Candidatus Aenigmarchaeota archaeon]
MENIIVGRDEEDEKKYGESGAVFLGKHLVGEGDEAHTTNPILMDVVKPHIVLVVGKRGTGKCVEENTPIVLEDGSVVPIKDLENDNRRVIGLDQKLKINPLEKAEFYKRKVNRLLHIKTRSGKEIKLTHEHQLLTIKGWVPVKDLTIGSRIATPRKIESFGETNIEDYKIKLLAYLIAEGHIKKRGNRALVRFTNTDKSLVQDFNSSIKLFDKNLKTTEYGRGSYGISRIKKTGDPSEIKRNENGRFVNGNIVRPNRNPLILWLEQVDAYDRLSRDKIIPTLIFNLKKDQISLFLNRLFSCDGSIYKHKENQWEISYASSSQVLIRQVHHLLLRFGMLSRIRNKKTKCNGKFFDTFEIVIGSENVNKFINEIGFFGHKQRKVENFINCSKNIYRNPNIDTIPKEVWDIYRPRSWTEVGRQMNYSIAKGLRTSINYSPSRQKLMQIAQLDHNNIIHTIATSDIFWDQIVFVEELEGDFTVCDITVPEAHNFVASDIIVHNSYSGGVIAEEITMLPKSVKENLATVIIDTMGIFWSMKNANDRASDALKDWNVTTEDGKRVLKPSGVDIKLFVPKAYVKNYKEAGVEVDSPLTMPCGELSADDWIVTFGFQSIDKHGIAIERAIKMVKKKYGDKYAISDIISAVQSDKTIEQEVKYALINRFEAAEGWGIFEEQGTAIKDLLQPGVVSVIDVSHYMRVSGGWSVRSLLVGILSRKIFMERLMARKAEEFEMMTGTKKKGIPMVWMLIDEAHQFVPNDKETASTDPLLTLIKEGREPGISVLLMTQRPGKLHEDALSQADLIISHRLTSRADIEALRSIMQTYMIDDIQDYLNALPKAKGSALILDDNSERLYGVQVRPRISWHAGGSPAAIKEKSKFE